MFTYPSRWKVLKNLYFFYSPPPPELGPRDLSPRTPRTSTGGYPLPTPRLGVPRPPPTWTGGRSTPSPPPSCRLGVPRGHTGENILRNYCRTLSFYDQNTNTVCLLIKSLCPQLWTLNFQRVIKNGTRSQSWFLTLKTPIAVDLDLLTILGSGNFLEVVRLLALFY